MNPYGLALAMTSIFGVILFAIIYFVSNDAHIAEGVGALPIVASHNVAEMLERRETRALVALKGTAVIESVKTFAIGWPIIVVYGTLIIVAVDVITYAFVRTANEFFAVTDATVDWPTAIGAVLGAMPHKLVAGLMHTDLHTPAPVASAVLWATEFGLLVATTPLKLFAGFLVGRWIGMRSRSGSWALMLAVAIIGALLLPLAMGIIATTWGGAPGNRYPVATVAALSISSAEFALAGIVGVWRGHSRRLAGYMEYLLSVLPPESRETLVYLAYEEAKRVA
jgi:hypothetical protein